MLSTAGGGMSFVGLHCRAADEVVFCCFVRLLNVLKVGRRFLPDRSRYPASLISYCAKL